MKISEVIHKENLSVQEEMNRIFKYFPKDAEVYVREVPMGTYITTADKPCHNVYYILDGEMLPKYIYGNNAFVASRLRRHAVIGDIAVLGDLDYYTTSVMTVTKCRVLIIRGADYWKWILQDSDILKKQIEHVIEVLLGELVNKRYVEGESPEMRLLSYFVWYCRENMKEEKTVLVMKTRDEIAEEIGGISVRTINRKLAQFVELGLISVSHGKIRITRGQFEQIEQYILEEKRIN